jgi:hypothetical protein
MSSEQFIIAPFRVKSNVGEGVVAVCPNVILRGSSPLAASKHSKESHETRGGFRNGESRRHFALLGVVKGMVEYSQAIIIDL